MKLISTLIVSLGLCVSGAALAQQHDAHRDSHDQRPQHSEQQHKDPHRKGQRLAKNSRGDRVPDYRAHNLKAPPKGHEWRRVDNDYVLIAVATGVISSVIAASN